MRQLSTAAALVGVLALTAACGGEASETTEAGEPPATTSTPSEFTESPSPPEEDESPTEETTSAEPEPEPEGTVVEVTLADGQVTPAGERVEAAAGEPITFAIDADAAGELHVHANPETYIEFGPGRSEHEIVIEQPGIVEVELHEPALVVVQLEVR